jgi:moderate conductance mechanosensitive channel
MPRPSPIQRFNVLTIQRFNVPPPQASTPFRSRMASGLNSSGMFEDAKTNLAGLQKIAEPESSHFLVKLVLIVVLTLLAHGLVRLVHFLSNWLVRNSAAKRSPVGFVMHPPKFITLTRLVASALTFMTYSVALGYMLWVFGLDPKQFLATYLATASVIGLAVGFGCQGLVQDVVTGVTLILSDTLDVGDLIEVSGQIGRVERVGLRFTELTNFLNQQVFVPNRTISSIARFPPGGINAYADIQMPAGVDRKQIIDVVNLISRGTWTEFSAVILSEPELSEPQTVEAGGWTFIRVQFRIWPGQNALLETAFRQRMVSALKPFDANYTDWMVTITYRATNVSAAKGNVAI